MLAQGQEDNLSAILQDFRFQSELKYIGLFEI